MDKKMISRFEVKELLGEGSFSKIYKAIDNVKNCEIALKVEKEDKCKKILKFEYEILKDLQCLSIVPRVYEFVENDKMNFIVMELLGNNLSNLKKSMGLGFTDTYAYDILIQMLNCIENVHSKGYIHRDIKPSNFVICNQEKKVYIVDFGLAKLHLNKMGEAYPERKNADFRGTIAFASMNAHNRMDLGRRDDIWSFFFVILDILGEVVPWRRCGEDKDEIETRKNDCINNPEKLFLTTKCNKKQFFEMFYHIKSLKYGDKPDYELIRNKLSELLKEEITAANIKSEKNLMNIFSSSLFPHSNQLVLNQFFEMINNQKDSTKNSSGGYLSPMNNILFDNFSYSNSNFFNCFLNNYEEMAKPFEEEMLKKKRMRNPYEESTIRHSNHLIRENKNLSVKKMDENNENDQNSSCSLMNQLISCDKRLIDYFNNIKVFNNYLLNNLKYDLYTKINTIVGLMKGQENFNNFVLLQNIIFNQFIKFQQQQRFSNYIYAFPMVNYP